MREFLDKIEDPLGAGSGKFRLFKSKGSNETVFLHQFGPSLTDL